MYVHTSYNVNNSKSMADHPGVSYPPLSCRPSRSQSRCDDFERRNDAVLLTRRRGVRCGAVSTHRENINVETHAEDRQRGDTPVSIIGGM